MLTLQFWKQTRFTAVFLSLFSVSTAVQAQPGVSHIFLVQNSGWMEPFYADPNSSFKPLVNEIIKRVRQHNEEVVIASFNQSDGANQSPRLHHRGVLDAEITQAVNSIHLARKPSGAYADTDFKEALVGSITQFTPGRPAILWIFTNNKNSPKNSPETALKNKEFYSWLQNEPNIKRIVAYPYKLAVQGRHYRANGAMIYAVAYGDPADQLLQGMLENNRPFGEQPARLKPLNAEAITFVPKGAGPEQGFNVTLGRDQKTLIIQFTGESRPQIATLLGNFRNDFYPYDIQSAKVGFAVRLGGNAQGIQADISPGSIEAVPAGGGSQDIRVRIAIPPLPSIWNPDVIFGSGYQIPGMMRFQLDEQRLAISPAFLDKMNQLFPGDPLPDLFVPGDEAKSSLTTRPILIVVNYPTWPLLLVAFVVIFLLGGGGYLAAAMLSAKKFKVSVDGVQRTYALKAFSSVKVLDDHGQYVGMLKRGLGKPAVRPVHDAQSTIRVL